MRNVKKPASLFFVVMGLVFALGGCGKPAPTGTPMSAEGNAEIGKTIRTQDFEFTLIEAPETATKVGSELVGGRRYLYDADGIFIIVPFRLTNDSDELRMLSASLLEVRDAQGRTFPLKQAYHHLGHIWTEERWMDERHLLSQNPMDPGLTREGPLIFDVARDSEGLVMTAEGTDDTIALGF